MKRPTRFQLRSRSTWAAICCALVSGVLAAPSVACAAENRPAAQVPEPTPKWLLHCGFLLDVTQRRILSNVAVRVEGGIIREVGPWPAGSVADAATVANSAGMQIIDLSRRYCLPGLMDLHVHLALDSLNESFLTTAMTQSSAAEALRSLKRAQTMLRHGFTTIRVVGEIDRQFSSVDLRDAINRGDFDGPRMLVAQHGFSETGGHGDFNDVHTGWPSVVGDAVPAGVDNVREAVRREKKHGADWIKICASGGVMTVGDDPRVQGFTDEEIAAFADEAHRLGMKIAAHVHGNRAALSVARARFDSIEHGTLMEDEAIALMKKNGVALVPTRYVVEWILDNGAKGGVSEENLAKARMVEGSHREALRKAYQAGVSIVMGSDPIFPHEQANREFAAMVRVGLAPWDAIRSGTLNAAQLLGLQAQIGSVEAGKQGDIVAVDTDPVADITALERVSFVMKAGKVIRDDGAGAAGGATTQ